MWPMILLFALMIPSTSSAQSRGSILDDPNFLDGIDQLGQAEQLGVPPCPTCGHDTGTAAVMPYLRERRNGLTFPLSTSVSGSECTSNRSYIGDSGQAGVPGGVSFCMRAGTRIRNLDFLAVDGSREGTYMYFSENISPLDSQNAKTAVLMLPRRGIPQVRVVGNELHVTLSTGELAVYHAQTKAYIRGPLRFGPFATAGTPTPFTYTGPSIVISASNNYKMPFEAGGAPTLTVTQQGQRCTIARGQLYNSDGRPLATTDTAMVATLNQHCTPRPARSFVLP